MRFISYVNMESMRAGKLLGVEPHVSPRIINLIKEQISMESEHPASSQSLVSLADVSSRYSYIHFDSLGLATDEAG